MMTEVKHSKSKSAWNIVGKTIGEKYKIAICPYIVVPDDEIITTKHKAEALEHALFISLCFNTSFNNM
jgi:hypothetical protein